MKTKRKKKYNKKSLRKKYNKKNFRKKTFRKQSYRKIFRKKSYRKTFNKKKKFRNLKGGVGQDLEQYYSYIRRLYQNCILHIVNVKRIPPSSPLYQHHEDLLIYEFIRMKDAFRQMRRRVINEINQTDNDENRDLETEYIEPMITMESNLKEMLEEVVPIVNQETRKTLLFWMRRGLVTKEEEEERQRREAEERQEMERRERAAAERAAAERAEAQASEERVWNRERLGIMDPPSTPLGYGERGSDRGLAPPNPHIQQLFLNRDQQMEAVAREAAAERERVREEMARERERREAERVSREEAERAWEEEERERRARRGNNNKHRNPR